MRPAPRRILVRVPTWVGDAVMATPVFRALRAAHPEAEITLEGRPVLEGLLRGLPSFDRFLPDSSRGLRSTLARAGELRRRGFDWAVLLPDSQRAALGPWLARIPRRVGYARDVTRRALLSEALAPPTENGRRVPIPMTERYLRITRHLDCPDRGFDLELGVDPGVAERCEAQLRRLGVPPEQPLLVVTPGANFGASKLWPTEHFAAACDGIARRLGLLPVLAPGPTELAIAGRIAEAAQQRVAALVDPSPTLEELKALIARSRLVLTNDTGPRHIAVALDRPVIVVMGPTDPRHTAQHLERQRVLREDAACSPCQLKTCPIDHRCMTGLDPARAISAAEQLLPTTPSNTTRNQGDGPEKTT
jgi:heptosyltransferase-2